MLYNKIEIAHGRNSEMRSLRVHESRRSDDSMSSGGEGHF